MGAILIATSIPGSHIPDVPIPNFDKAVHLSMYGILAALVARAILNGRRGSSLAAVVTTVILCSALGAADELHQRLLPDRSTDPRDWVADTTGSALGAVAFLLFRHRRNAARPT